MSPLSSASARAVPPRWLAHGARLAERWLEPTALALWPLVDLAVRIWFGARLLPVMVDWPLGPALGILLIAGLATQPVALVTIWFCVHASIGFVGHATELMLLLWLGVAGSSHLSLDYAFGLGARSIALPFVERLSMAITALASVTRSPLLLLTRLVAATVLTGMAMGGAGSWSYFVLSGWQPPAFSLPIEALILATAALLALGIAARAVALATLLVVVLAIGMPATGLIFLLAILALRGPGTLSLDRLVRQRLDGYFPYLFAAPAWDDASVPHVVIVGAGFGGVAAARALAHTPCRITLIDRRNYHLFQPLLYQVATASLSPANIATPIRSLFRDQRNVRVRLGRVTDVDRQGQAVLLDDQRLAFDYLVLATGARHSYFGREEWEPLAPGLKKIDDATDIRRRILLAFERAEDCDDDAERAAWLTFIVVGGGPTGVELAGTLGELARHGMARDFRRCDPAAARIILIDSGDYPLKAFDDRLQVYTAKALGRLGVELWPKKRVEAIDVNGVVASGTRIEARTVIWAAGVVASPANRWLQAPHDPAGRVHVEADLSVAGSPEIFVVGDTASCRAWKGNPVPGLAPAAKQAGAHAALVIRRRIVGRAAPGPFVYRHQGNMATIGRQAAVAEIGRLRLKGGLAWWFWGVVHVLFLVDNQSRATVALQWVWAYLTFQRSTRLITGELPQASMPASGPPPGRLTAPRGSRAILQRSADRGGPTQPGSSNRLRRRCGLAYQSVRSATVCGLEQLPLPARMASKKCWPTSVQASRIGSSQVSSSVSASSQYQLSRSRS